MDTQLAVFSSLGIAICLGLYYFFIASTDSYEKEQWVGRQKDQWFSMFRANIRSITTFKSLLEEGHKKFSKKEQLYMIPEFGSLPYHILPPSQIPAVLKQPDSILSAHIAQHESLQTQYTIADKRVMSNGIHMDVISRQLTRHLGIIIPFIAEELELAMDHHWGTDTQNFKEIKLMDTVMKIVSRAANRSFVGTELCRNEKWTENCKNYSVAVFGAAGMIKMLPKWLRPVLGPLISWPAGRYIRKCFVESRGLIVERLRLNEMLRNDEKFEWDPPADFLQWLIEETYTRNLPQERDPELVNRRLCLVNMVAIHTTTLTTVATILDLYSTKPSAGFIEGLREECTRVLAEEGGWSRAAISKMIRVDSAVRESMRTSTLGQLALTRVVTAPKGVTLSNSIHLRKGARVGFSAYSIHHDSDIYPDANHYDAFRFSRPREAYQSSLQSQNQDKSQIQPQNELNQSHEEFDQTKPQIQDSPKKDLNKILEFKNTSMVSVSDDFLAFGNGRHSCIGRFFASNEVKMVIAMLVLKYDVEFMEERVEDRMILQTRVPGVGTTIRIRRREG